MTGITGSNIINRSVTPSSHSFYTEYGHSSDFLAIDRRGLYEMAWEIFNGTINSSKAVSFKAASFCDENKKSQFYRIKTEINSTKASKTLFIFILDPWLMPLYLLRDSLQNYKKNVKSEVCELFAYIETFSHFNPLKHTEYVHAFYRIISEELGCIPKAVSLVDLTKMASMNEWMVYEAGTEWLCSDNFIVHLCLSKKAQYLNLGHHDAFKVEKKTRLSRHHEIEYGSCQLKDAPDPFALAKLLPTELASTQYSSLSVPDLFIEAIYKNKC